MPHRIIKRLKKHLSQRTLNKKSHKKPPEPAAGESPKKIHSTSNHAFIKKWAEERGGIPSRVRMFSESGRGQKVGGILRLDFWGHTRNLEHITWDNFFTVFDYNRFAFLYQEEIGGEKSNYYSLVPKKPTHEDAKPVKHAVESANRQLSSEEGELEETNKEMDEGEIHPEG